MTNMKKYVLFDNNGTIIKSHKDNFLALKTGLKHVFDIDVDLSKVQTHGMTDRHILEESAKLHGVSKEEFKAKLPEITKIMKETVERSGTLSKKDMYPGVEELLKELKDRGYRIGLATGNVKGVAFAILKSLGIEDYFEGGGFGDNSYKRSEMVKEGLNSLEIDNTESVIIIGDTPNDIKSAHVNNVKGVGVATGNYSVNDLKKAQADLVIEDLTKTEEVANYIDQLIK